MPSMDNIYKSDNFVKNYPNRKITPWLKRGILSRQYIFLFYAQIIRNSKNVGMKYSTANDLRFSSSLQTEWAKTVSEIILIDVDNKTKAKQLNSLVLFIYVEIIIFISKQLLIYIILKLKTKTLLDFRLLGDFIDFPISGNILVIKALGIISLAPNGNILPCLLYNLEIG